jgi:adenylate cyclase
MPPARTPLGGLFSEFTDPGAPDIPGRTLWRVGRLVITTLIVGANLIGAASVLSVAYFVVPTPHVRDLHHIQILNALTAAIYIPLALVLGALVGTRGLFEIRQWLIEGRVATSRDQRLVLRAPIRFFVVQASLWLGAALIFGLLDGHYSAEFGSKIALSITITGLVTATCAYLLTERVLRGAVARAIAQVGPEEVAV